jgi:hypothetical protein
MNTVRRVRMVVLVIVTVVIAGCVYHAPPPPLFSQVHPILSCEAVGCYAPWVHKPEPAFLTGTGDLLARVQDQIGYERWLRERTVVYVERGWEWHKVSKLHDRPPTRRHQPPAPSPSGHQPPVPPPSGGTHR